MHRDYLPDWLVNPFPLQYGQQSPSRQSQACHFSFFCNNEHVKTWVRPGSHAIAQCWEVEPRVPGQPCDGLGGLGVAGLVTQLTEQMTLDRTLLTHKLPPSLPCCHCCLPSSPPIGHCSAPLVSANSKAECHPHISMCYYILSYQLSSIHNPYVCIKYQNVTIWHLHTMHWLFCFRIPDFCPFLRGLGLQVSEF